MITIYNIKDRYIQYAVLIIFVFAGSILYTLDQTTASFFVFSFAIGIFLYLISERNSSKPKIHFYVRTNKTMELILNISFFILFTISLLSTKLYADNKGFIYYLCITFLAGIIFINILMLNVSKKRHILLLELIMLSLNVFYSNSFIFPYGTGTSGDTYYHIYQIIIPTMQAGFLPFQENYYFFPMHHLLVSIVGQLVSISAEKSYFATATMVTSIGMLFVYVMANKFLDSNAGYISSLIYISSGYVIYQASHPFQSTFALPLAIILIYTVLSQFNSNNIQYKVLFLIILTSLIFSHPHSTGIVFVVLLILTFCELYSNIRYSTNYKVMKNKVVLFFLVMLAHWMFYSLYLKNIVYTIDIYLNTFSNEMEYVQAITSSSTLTIPLYLLILDKLYYISITIATIGFLYSLKKNTIFHIFLNSFSLFFISILCIGMFIKVPILASGRLFTYLESFGFTFLSTYAIIQLRDFNKLISKRNISLLFAIMLLFFFTTSSSISGIETSLYTKSNVAYDKKYDTPHERNSINWANLHITNISQILISNNFIPYRYSMFERYKINGTSVDISSSTKKYIVFNKYDILTGIRVDFSEKEGSTNVKLNTSTLSDLNRHNKYYNNGIINVFYVGI